MGNAQHAGPICNMTISEYRAAKIQGSDFVVQVRTHKTFATYGQAKLVLTPRQHALVTSWMAIRSRLVRRGVGHDCQNVFTNLSGAPLRSNSVVRAPASAFEKEIVTPTRLRKAIVITVRIFTSMLFTPSGFCEILCCMELYLVVQFYKSREGRRRAKWWRLRQTCVTPPRRKSNPTLPLRGWRNRTKCHRRSVNTSRTFRALKTSPFPTRTLLVYFRSTSCLFSFGSEWSIISLYFLR